MSTINEMNQTLAEQDVKTRPGYRPASAIRREMGEATAPAPASENATEGVANTNPTIQSEVAQTAQRGVILSPEVEAAIARNKMRRVIDGDTFRNLGTGESNRMFGIDAPESIQAMGEKAKAAYEKLMQRATRVEVVGKDVYGRNLVEVYDEDGNNLGKEMVLRGLAKAYGFEETDNSEGYVKAELEAKSKGVGIHAPENSAELSPKGFRDNGMTKGERWWFQEQTKRLRSELRELQTPEFFEQMEKREREEASVVSEEAEMLAPIRKLASSVAELAGIGFRYERMKLDIDDISQQDQVAALEIMQERFGYTIEDFARLGMSPKEAAVQYIENAMGIARTQQRRQEAFAKLSYEEKNEAMNAAFYGEDAELQKTFTIADHMKYEESLAVGAILEMAFASGAKAETVATALMMALSEHQSEEEHFNRLSQMPVDQARVATNIFSAIRAQQDWNLAVKACVALWNASERTLNNIGATISGNAIGKASDKRVIELLAQEAEDSQLVRDGWIDEGVLGAAESLPSSALWVIPKAGWLLAFVEAYGEQSRTPVLEDWHDYDPVTAEAVKLTMAIVKPLLERWAIEKALSPAKSAITGIFKGSPTFTGFVSGKTMNQLYASAEQRSVVSKLAIGVAETSRRTAMGVPAEFFEETGVQFAEGVGGLIVDPKSKEGKRLYNWGRVSSDSIDAGIAAFKTAPFLMMPFAATGTISDGLNVGNPYFGVPKNFSTLSTINPLQTHQDAVNMAAVADSAMRAQTIGGLKEDEVVNFYIKNREARKEELDQTESKAKKKWLTEIDTYLRIKEDAEARRMKQAEAKKEGESAEEAATQDTNVAPKVNEAAESSLAEAVENAAVKPKDSDEGADSDPNAKVEPEVNEEFEQNAVEADDDDTLTEADKQALNEEPEQKPAVTETSDTVTETPGIATETAQEAVQTTETTIPPEAKTEAAVEPPKVQEYGFPTKPKMGIHRAIASVRKKAIARLPEGTDLSDILPSFENEIAMVTARKKPDKSTCNPALVSLFEGAANEGKKTGVDILGIFAKGYELAINLNVDNPGDYLFTRDPEIWATQVIGTLVELARKHAAGDAEATKRLEDIYKFAPVIGKPQKVRQKKPKTGKMSDHARLEHFAKFSRKWLQSVFPDADIYFVEDLGDKIDPDVAKEFENKHVNAAIDFGSGNVYVRKTASPTIVLHEVFGHATFAWMRTKDKKGYDAILKLVEAAPEHIKERVRRSYGYPEGDPNLDARFVDEVFAFLVEQTYANKVDALCKTFEDRAWYVKYWKAIAAAIKKFWRAMSGKETEMTPQEFLDMLSLRFFGHRGITAYAKPGKDTNKEEPYGKYDESGRFMLHKDEGADGTFEDLTDEDEEEAEKRADEAAEFHVGEGLGNVDHEDFYGDVDEDEAQHRHKNDKTFYYWDQDVFDLLAGKVLTLDAKSLAGRVDVTVNEKNRKTYLAPEQKVSQRLKEEVEKAIYEFKQAQQAFRDAEEDYNLAKKDDDFDIAEAKSVLAGSKRRLQVAKGRLRAVLSDIRASQTSLYELRNTESDYAQALYDVYDTLDFLVEEKSKYIKNTDEELDFIETWDEFVSKKEAELRKNGAGVRLEIFQVVADIASRFGDFAIRPHSSLAQVNFDRLSNEIERVEKLLKSQQSGKKPLSEQQLKKVKRQLDAAKKLVGLAIVDRGQLRAIRDFASQYIGMLRPQGHQIGRKMETDVEGADYREYGINTYKTDVRRLGSDNSARVLEISPSVAIYEDPIRIHQLKKNWGAILWMKEMAKGFLNHSNPYVVKHVKNWLGVIEDAEVAAENEFREDIRELTINDLVSKGVRRDKAREIATERVAKLSLKKILAAPYEKEQKEKESSKNQKSSGKKPQEVRPAERILKRRHVGLTEIIALLERHLLNKADGIEDEYTLTKDEHEALKKKLIDVRNLRPMDYVVENLKKGIKRLADTKENDEKGIVDEELNNISIGLLEDRLILVEEARDKMVALKKEYVANAIHAWKQNEVYTDDPTFLQLQAARQRFHELASEIPLGSFRRHKDSRKRFQDAMDEVERLIKVRKAELRAGAKRGPEEIMAEYNKIEYSIYNGMPPRKKKDEDKGKDKAKAEEAKLDAMKDDFVRRNAQMPQERNEFDAIAEFRKRFANALDVARKESAEFYSERDESGNLLHKPFEIFEKKRKTRKKVGVRTVDEDVRVATWHGEDVLLQGFEYLKLDVLEEIAEAQKFLNKKGNFTGKRKEKTGIETEIATTKSGSKAQRTAFETMPERLREMIEENRKLPKEQRESDETIVKRYISPQYATTIIKDKDGNVVAKKREILKFGKSWVGLFSTMSEDLYNFVLAETERKILLLARIRVVQEMQSVEVSHYEFSEKVEEAKPKRRFAYNVEDNVNPDAGAEEAFNEERDERTTAAAAAILVRMARTKKVVLEDKEIADIVYTLFPYVGGAARDGLVDSAKFIAQLVALETNVEKLSSAKDAIKAVRDRISRLTADELVKMVEMLTHIQTDQWKIEAARYRKQQERIKRTGRDMPFNPMSKADLEPLKIFVKGKKSNLYKKDEEGIRLGVSSFIGLGAKIRRHLWAAKNKPKREKFATAEEYNQAVKDHEEFSKSPYLLAKYRDTLVWLYGKYVSDPWLRAFFDTETSTKVRQLVAQMRDFGDTVKQVSEYATQIERILSRDRDGSWLNARKFKRMVERLLSDYSEPFDPNTPMNKRKVSPAAHARLHAMYKGMGMTKGDLEAKIKEAEDDYKKFNEKDDDKVSNVKDSKKNAVKAVIELNTINGYKAVLPYVKTRAITSNSLKRFQKLYDEVVDTLVSGRQEVEDHIEEQTERANTFISKLTELCKTGKSGKKNLMVGRDKIMHRVTSTISAYVKDGFTLKQRLAEMVRFIDDPDKHAEALRLIDEYINDPIVSAESKMSEYEGEAREELNKMLMRTYHGTEEQDINKILKTIAELEEKHEDFKKFSWSGEERLSRNDLMGIVAMMRQDDVRRPLYEIEEKITRGELEFSELNNSDQRLLTRLRNYDAMIEALRKISDGKDLEMIDAMHAYYNALAPRLDAVSVKISGAPVSIDSDYYFPVARSSEWAARDVNKAPQVVSVIPDFLSPRKDTMVDLEETAGLINTFIEQSKRTSHFLAFGEQHYFLTSVFNSDEFSNLANKMLGNKEAKNLKDHAQDICAPHLMFIDNSGANALWSFLRKWTSILLLGGNVLVGLKQVTSITAFAHEVGWRKMLSAVVANWSDPDVSALRKELFESPEAKARWGNTWVGIQDDMLKNRWRPGTAKFFSRYMAFQRMGDKVSAFVVAPGLYAANYRTLCQRINEDTGRPYTEEEAKTKAREMVFDVIEKTQQSSRVSNLGGLQRRGSALAQLWSQFASAPILMFSSEIRALRDVIAVSNSKDRWLKLAGTMASNHIVIPSLLMGLEMLARMILQDDEPDEEDLKDLLGMMLTGPFSGAIILGNTIFESRDVSAPAASFVSRTLRHGEGIVADTFSGEFGEAGEHAYKLAKSLVPIFRDVMKPIEAYALSDESD